MLANIVKNIHVVDGAFLLDLHVRLLAAVFLINTTIVLSTFRFFGVASGKTIHDNIQDKQNGAKTWDIASKQETTIMRTFTRPFRMGGGGGGWVSYLFLMFSVYPG